MTEEEARTKVCPEMSAVTYDSYKIGKQLCRQKCIVSDCILWKWETRPEIAAKINEGRDRGAVSSGHCGLIK